MEVDIDLSSSWEEFVHIMEELIRPLKSNFIYTVLMALGFLSALRFGLKIARALYSKKLPEPTDLLPLLSVISILFACSITGVFIDFAASRYFIGIIFPLTILGLLDFCEFSFKNNKIRVFIMLLAIVLAIKVIRHDLDSGWPWHMKLQPLEACLERHAPFLERYNGVSDYWNAKPARMLAGGGSHRLKINQIKPNGLSPYYWITNKQWYYDKKGRPLKYNFIIISRIRTEVLQSLGRPDNKLKCSRHEIWFYEKPFGLKNMAINTGSP